MPRARERLKQRELGQRMHAAERCKYDGKCYQLNPLHWDRFRHDLQTEAVPRYVYILSENDLFMWNSASD